MLTSAPSYCALRSRQGMAAVLLSGYCDNLLAQTLCFCRCALSLDGENATQVGSVDRQFFTCSFATTAKGLLKRRTFAPVLTGSSFH